MTKYRVTVPFIPDMGSVADLIVTETPMESKEEQALWHINSMRDHDGLPRRSSLPRGVYFPKLED